MPPAEFTWDAVYVSIGNSDDKLTQRQWGSFCRAVEYAIEDYKPFQIYGKWYSLPGSDYQNACFAFSKASTQRSETDFARYNAFLKQLGVIAEQHRQDSIAVAEANTQFVRPPDAPGLKGLRDEDDFTHTQRPGNHMPGSECTKDCEA